MFIYIDAFTICNLRCPSCTVGDYNRREGRPLASKGMMRPATLGRILDKALAEIENVEGVGFFNWTEPLLHPQIAELVREVSTRNIKCWLSSNLNVLREPDALIAAGPHELIVSVSGFNQHIYERGHRGGNIEIVKSNMVRLARAAERSAEAGTRTWLRLVYHRYRDNAEDEDLMERYAVGLGYTFTPVWAYVTSVERVLDIQAGRTFKDDDELLNRLALPLSEAMRIVGARPTNSCGHIEGRLVLDADANVYLCCASSGSTSNIVGNFLTSSLLVLQAAKAAHPLCAPCMKHAVMNYFDRATAEDDPEFSNIGHLQRSKFPDSASNIGDPI